MELQVQGQKAALEVSPELFETEFNEPLIHQVVTAYLAGARSGTKAQKTRAQVRGGGRKPWKQKGTGRARAGTIRSPIWRGGGTTFAAVPRDYSQKVNRKMYRAAMRSIAAELVRQERLIVVKSLELKEPKTKLALAALAKLGVDNGLIITTDVDLNLALATRNIPYVDVCTVGDVNPVALVGYEKIVMTADAVKQFEESLA